MHSVTIRWSHETYYRPQKERTSTTNSISKDESRRCFESLYPLGTKLIKLDDLIKTITVLSTL